MGCLSKGAPNQESGVIKSFPASPSNNHDTQKDELQFEPTWETTSKISTTKKIQFTFKRSGLLSSSYQSFKLSNLDAVNLKNEKTEKRLDLLAAQNENLKKMLELKIII
jgi:hypothetical protein